MLLRDAVITLTQLEQALRSQVLTGGRLGTNLVELGFVELNTMSRYLARSADAPLAIADRFEKADPALIEAFGAEMADRYCAIPLSVDTEDSNTVLVALRDPSDRETIAAIEAHLHKRVAPLVAAELRLFYYLERYYGIRRRTRFTRTPDTEDAVVHSRRERRATQPFRGLSAPGMISIVPRKRRASSSSEAPVAIPDTLSSFANSFERIDQSSHRDDIADAILEFTVGRFECAALFIVRSMNAIGWRAQAPGLGVDALERLSLPLGGASIFQTAHDSGKPYRGKALSPGHPLESEVWAHFVIEHEPDDLHVIPIVVASRPINLLYAHSFAGQRHADQYHQELCELAIRAGAAYRRLMASSTGAA